MAETDVDVIQDGTSLNHTDDRVEEDQQPSMIDWKSI